MLKQLTKMTPVLFAGAAAAVIAAAPVALADPWVTPDGTACAVIGPDGASGAVPGGPGGAAGPGGATGAIPGGPSGTAGPGGASGCIPGVGCLNVG
jgi:hypothetical protein